MVLDGAIIRGHVGIGRYVDANLSHRPSAPLEIINLDQIDETKNRYENSDS